jgi:hypothetical protein
MTNGWTDASGWQITLPTAQELAAEIGAYMMALADKKEDLWRSLYEGHWPMKPMTATEVIENRRKPETWDRFDRYLEGFNKTIAEAFAVNLDLLAPREMADDMMGLRAYIDRAMRQVPPPKPPEPKVTPIIDRAGKVYEMLCARGFDTSEVSIVLPEEDWVVLAEELDLFYNWKPEEGASRLRYFNIEYLRGSRDYFVYFGPRFISNRDALACEIIRCLSGGRVSELPKSTSGNGVSTSPDTGGEISVAASPAISDNRNRNGVRHIPDQLDVVSAKAALAAYARDKKLPGSVSLAQLRELDRNIAMNKPKAQTSEGRKFTVRDIKSYSHGLSSKPLGRAIDQLNVAEHSRAHRDFIGAAAQGFAEMLDAGDATAHRKR